VPHSNPTEENATTSSLTVERSRSPKVSKMKSRAKGTRQLRLIFLVLLIGAQLVTLVFATIALGGTSEVALQQRLSADLAHASSEAANKIAAYLDAPRRLRDLTAKLTTTVGSQNDELLERVFVNTLKATPHVASVFVGRSDGSFVFASQTPSGYFSKIIRIDGTKRTVTTYRRATFDGVPIAEIIDDPYDPRTRPWYKLAVSQPSSPWTQPYTFATSKMPGITTAAMVDPGNASSPVVGVDVELSELHAYVDTLKVSPQGASMVIDSNAKALGGLINPVFVDFLREQKDLVAPGEKARLHELVYRGNKYAAANAPIEGSPDWRIVTTSPESDYFAERHELQRRLIEVAVVSGFATTAIAFALFLFVKRRLDLVAEQSNIDQLTQVLNRARLLELAGRRLMRNQRNGDHTYVCIVDIDSFKSINDTFGHDGGDLALRTVAQRLADMMRANDLFGRYGGEEFLFVFDRVDQKTALFLVDRIRAIVSDEPIQLKEQLLSITVSAGVASTHNTPNTQTLADLITRADHALYDAKHAGKNRTVYSEVVPSASLVG
jgi:diguanylate cyclase (GGDEF)-like protein